MSENGKLVERITIKIKVFDTGKWEWNVRQRFVNGPRIKVDDILKIFDEIKAEILATEGRIEKEERPATVPVTTTGQATLNPPRKKNKKKNSDT